MSIKVLSLISVMFSCAITWNLHEGINPAKGIVKAPTKKRRRRLEYDEYPRFFEAVAKYPTKVVRDVIYMCLFTGMRWETVTSMRWDDIHSALLVVPSIERGKSERREVLRWLTPETKNGEPVYVYFSSPAVQVLDSRRDRDESPWVFPSRGKTGHIVNISKAWCKILVAAVPPIVNLRIHDLRKSHTSEQFNTGFDLATAGEAVGHKTLETTRDHYVILDNALVADAFESAAQRMLEYGEDEFRVG